MRNRGKIPALGCLVGPLERVGLNASLSLTVVNCLRVIRPAREGCIDAHIDSMAPEVNRSFPTSSAVSAVGPKRHLPVLLRQAIAYLAPRDGGVYIDGTFGAGGYAAAILGTAAARVIGIDRDASAVAAGRAQVEA